MTIGYVMNSYPMVSTTFIGREIAALERQGLTVRRYAIRPWEGPLVDPADRAEQARTTYLLAPAPRLLAGLAAEALRNPLGLARGLAATLRLARAARGRVVAHVAYLLEAVQLKRRAEADGVGHLHAHFSTNSAAVALICARLGGPSYSFTVHGPDELLDTAANALPLKLHHAAFAAAITAYCRGRVAAEGGEGNAGKVHVVPCGLDMGDFPAAAPPVAADNHTLVCVGRLCPQKAQALLPEAARGLVGEFPALRIVLIGDGESRAEIEGKVAQYGLEENVVLAGWGTGAEVRAAIEGARALVLPSFAEGLPIVIMEAFAIGRPVISTRIAGIPELLDETCGWIVEPGDVPALEAALRACLAAPPEALQAMGQEGRARILARHDQDKAAARLRALIEKAAPGAVPGPVPGQQQSPKTDTEPGDSAPAHPATAGIEKEPAP